MGKLCYAAPLTHLLRLCGNTPLLAGSGGGTQDTTPNTTLNKENTANEGWEAQAKTSIWEEWDYED